jgi:hypothetical protein
MRTSIPAGLGRSELLKPGDMILIEARRAHDDQRFGALPLCGRERVRH